MEENRHSIYKSTGIPGLVIGVQSMDDGHNVKCPRCWRWHSIRENFGFTEEEIVENPKLAKEKLCDECQQIILGDWPEHSSVPFIKEALRKQKEKYERMA